MFVFVLEYGKLINYKIYDLHDKKTKNPVLPMVRQKCLDLLSNVTTVPDVAYSILQTDTWFLDSLLIMIRDGDMVSDKIPALSVLIRLLKVILTKR